MQFCDGFLGELRTQGKVLSKGAAPLTTSFLKHLEIMPEFPVPAMGNVYALEGEPRESQARKISS
jgi:hypothetical protein